jgi:hypothetical protein
LENLEEMDKFPDTNDHPKMNQKGINHLSRFITHMILKQQKRVSQKTKVHDLMDSLLNSIRPLMKI